MTKKWPEPGRALDLLVMEHCLGWRWVKGGHYDVCSIANPVWLLPSHMGVGDVGPGCWCGYDEDNGELRPGDNRLTLFDVPQVSTQLGDAAQVWDSIRGLGYIVEVETYPEGSGEPARVTVRRPGKAQMDMMFGDTPAHALCLMRLKLSGWRPAPRDTNQTP